MSKYITANDQEARIIKTTTLYSDGKTQVPKEVIAQLKLKRGSVIVWVKEKEKIFIKNG